MADFFLRWARRQGFVGIEPRKGGVMLGVGVFFVKCCAGEPWENLVIFGDLWRVFGYLRCVMRTWGMGQSIHSHARTFISLLEYVLRDNSGVYSHPGAYSHSLQALSKYCPAWNRSCSPPPATSSDPPPPPGGRPTLQSSKGLSPPTPQTRLSTAPTSRWPGDQPHLCLCLCPSPSLSQYRA
jgi:hypothetical protein